ncbi:hypothetical protein SUNI508_09204 [Seiridium unicorne]|uniref:Uncharacterized protein n=1 Tax=Seiridium unicorne TaxID=138068 RepID=A0ABR2UQN5_9PEZI
MLHLSPHESRLHRSQSATSVAASVTTYHSFHDIELHESAPAQRVGKKELQSTPMKRHDSGYASIPSGSQSGDSYGSGRRISTTSTNSSQARPRTRPSIRRAARSTPSPRTSMSSYSIQRPRSQQHSSAYFQFPSLEGPSAVDEGIHEVEEPLYPPPPQTTHYWTSDHTRKLEYAAIDAASQGIKGWILKYVIPDCFVPKQSRRLGFDDDSGSVRRYRLELECDDQAEKQCKKNKKMGWLAGR